MKIIRIPLQVVLVAFFLLVLAGTLRESSLTSTEIGNLLSAFLFFALLFVGTFSLGKHKQTRLVHGYRVNPKVFGVMVVLLGLFVFSVAWRIFSGQPMSSGSLGQGLTRFIQEHGPWIPGIGLVVLGLAAGWLGIRVYRGR